MDGIATHETVNRDRQPPSDPPPRRSYAFEQHTDQVRSAEIKRLRRQALVAVQRERVGLRAAGLCPGHRVLEVGCGPGFISGVLADLAAPGEVVGIDVCSELLDVARDAVAPEHVNLSFEHGDAYSTGFEDGRFDFVFNRFLYQHLQHPTAALAEARRVTRPGGRICIVDVDAQWQTLYPRSAAFEELVAMATRVQAERHGDREVGRKLPSWMIGAGLRDVRLEIGSLSSLECGLEAFIDLTTRLASLADEDRARDLHEELAAELPGRRSTVGLIGIFTCVGTA